MGLRYLAGGDYNAKHPWWRSRLANPKGIELYKSITNTTVWTINWKPYVLAGHTPVIVNFNNSFQCYSCSKRRLLLEKNYIASFQNWLDEKLRLMFPLKINRTMTMELNYFLARFTRHLSVLLHRTLTVGT